MFTCDICRFHCRIPSEGFGLCGKIKNIGNEKIKYQEPKWVYFSTNQSIEVTHFYHIWPGIRTDIIYIGEKPYYRFYFSKFYRMLFNDAILEIRDSNKKAVFFGGFEPLIDIAHFSSDKIHILDYYRIRLTETFGLIDPKRILKLPVSFDGILYNIMLDKSFPYMNPMFKVNDHIKGIESLLELGLHVEIIILFAKDSKFIDKNISNLAKKLYEIGPDIPLHLVRLNPTLKEPSVSVSTGRLVQIWKLLKNMGFRHVYIDGLFLSDKNYTNCHCKGKEVKLLDHHGPWNCILGPLDSTCLKECNIMGKPSETLPSLEKKKIC